ncbi:CHAP domain-containing protein [Humitalea rosea]|nr:CHAP domain-containing protein [Humitalea rosea]
MSLVCTLLALPPLVREAAAERSKPGEARSSGVRTGGNASHIARAAGRGTPAAKPAERTANRAIRARPTAARPTAARPTAARASTSRTVSSRGSRVTRVSLANTPRYTTRAGGLSCVPYARLVTGMAVSGNAGDWWRNAAGAYDRGRRPEAGSVIVLRATGSMRLGHVAVVERIVSAREVRVHHSNWGGPGIRRGTVMRNVSVIDASENNDWSVVRVQVGHSNESYGSSYPVAGFIYNRPEGGRILRAANGNVMEEVAEAPRSPHATAHEALSLESLTNRP